MFIRRKPFATLLRCAPLVAAVASLAGLANAQDDAPAARAQATIFVAQKSGLSALLVDPRDQALKRALEMLPARLTELPDEVPELSDAPPSLLELVGRLIVDGVFVGVTDRGNDPQTGAPGVGISLAIGAPSEANAKSVSGDLLDLVRAQPGMQIEPSRAFKGMVDIETPGGTLRFGPRRCAAGDWTISAIMGDVPDPDAAAAALPTMAGADAPFARFRLDLPAAQQWTAFFAGLASLQAPQIGKIFQERGLTGPDAISVDMVVAQTADALRSRLVVERAKRYAKTLGVSDRRLGADDLRIIPADAVFATAQTFEMGAIWAAFEGMALATPEGQQALAQFAERTGLDIKTDIVDAIGDALAIYTSDATGGGGLFSGVAVVGVKDRAKVQNLFDRAAEAGNALLAEGLPRPEYVRFQRSSAGGVERLTVAFPGLPVPMQATLALTDRYLVTGFTPQAVDAAIAQAAGKAGRSLLDNGAFKSVMPAMPDDLTQLSFIDSARAIGKGYPWISSLTTAISNAMRSPANDSRDPGNLLPPYAEIAASVRPILQTARWEGENLVQEISADRSVIVNACAAAGVYGDLMSIVAPVAVGAVVPAIQKSKETATATIETMQLEDIIDAWFDFADDNNDRPPLSPQALVEAGYLVPESLQSPYGDPMDGGAHYWMRLPGPGFVLASDLDDLAIVAYSRSQAAADKGVTVAFADGYVEHMTMLDFMHAMQEPANAGVDFDLPEAGVVPAWPENQGGRRPNFMLLPDRTARRAM